MIKGQSLVPDLENRMLVVTLADADLPDWAGYAFITMPEGMHAVPVGVLMMQHPKIQTCARRTELSLLLGKTLPSDKNLGTVFDAMNRHDPSLHPVPAKAWRALLRYLTDGPASRGAKLLRKHRASAVHVLSMEGKRHWTRMGFKQRLSADIPPGTLEFIKPLRAF